MVAREPQLSSPEELRALVGLSADAILSIDEDQNIKLFNRGAEQTFGYRADEVLGRPLSILLPERHRERHARDVPAFGDSPVPARRMGERDGIVGVRKDGSEFPAEASILKFTVDGARRYGVVLRDVSESRGARRRLEQSEEVIRKLYEIAADPASNLHDRLHGLLELGTLQLGMETGVASRISGERYEVIEAYGAPEWIVPGSVLDVDQTYCSKTFHAMGPIGFSSARGSEWETHPCYRNTRLESYLGAPVLVGGDTYGTLAFLGLEPRSRSFTEQERELVRLMALWVGRELDVAERIEISRLLSRGGEALTGSFDYREIRGIVAGLAIPTLADAAVIYLPVAENRIRRVEAAADIVAAREREVDRDALERAEGRPHPALEILSAAHPAPRTVDPALKDEDTERETSGPPMWPRSLGYESALVVPIVAKGDVLAALALLSESPAKYGPREWLAARELATLAGFALAHGAMHQASTEAVKAREDLLSFVSHDLGNPIATISMVAERLLGYPEEEDRRKQSRFYLEGIAEAVSRMERLVRDLLEVQVLEEGRRGIYLKEIEAGPIVAEALRAFAQAAESKSIELTGTSGAEWTIRGDRGRILEVLGNLLDNAIKFTPPGGSVTIEARPRDGEVVFSVSDTGIGIGSKQITRLFDRYIQAHQKRRAGAGLGLAIAKEIVEGHGGSIWCESELGSGTTFRFTIPRA